MRTTVAAAAAVFLGGSVAAAPPPPWLPEPAPSAAVPMRPLPPAGAVASMPVPARDAAGVRLTINAYLSAAQTTWNLRSALNVAALNCRERQHALIRDSYGAFLAAHAKRLAAVDRALDREFRRAHGASFRAARDIRATQTYNYFAWPPTLPAFCDAALAVGSEAALVSPADLDAFAAEALPRLEQVFESFFAAFDRWRLEAAEWDARYAGGSPPFQPTVQSAPPGGARADALTGGPLVLPPASVARKSEVEEHSP